MKLPSSVDKMNWCFHANVPIEFRLKKRRNLERLHIDDGIKAVKCNARFS